MKIINILAGFQNSYNASAWQVWRGPDLLAVFRTRAQARAYVNDPPATDVAEKALHPIMAQALAPWAPPPRTELVTRALALGITAPDAARAQECADMAEQFAQGLTDDEVEQCKADAMRRAGL